MVNAQSTKTYQERIKFRNKIASSLETGTFDRNRMIELFVCLVKESLFSSIKNPSSYKKLQVTFFSKS